MNIVVDENIPLLADALSETGVVTSVSGRDINNSLLRKTNCDALFVRSITKVDETLLNNTDIKFVGSATAGIDHVETEYLREKGIKYESAPGANANSVAEYVIYTILVWAKSNNFNLHGKKAAVIGFGNVGKITADYFKRLGLTVLINDPPLKKEGFTFPDDYVHASLDECCQECEIITNHVPLTKDVEFPTYNLFDKQNIESIKVGSLFIHSSRGHVVDEKFLLERLTEREITAAIDVWENEPYVNPDLVKYSFMATPHIAGYSYDGKLKGALMMAKRFEEHFNLTTNKETIESVLKTDTILKEVSVDDDTLLNHLEDYRQLKEDYIRFLHSILSDDSDMRGTAFDKLRKEYPVRRECLK